MTYKPPSWDQVWNAPDPTQPPTTADIAKWHAQFQQDSAGAGVWARVNAWQNSAEAYQAFKAWETQNAARSAKDAKEQEAKSYRGPLTEDNVKNIGG